MPISKLSGSFRRNKRGFTLFEIVIVMGIMAVLSSMMLGYSQRNSKQILLATTQAKLASIFARAKFLSIQSFFYVGDQSDDVICGHGVYVDVDDESVVIFQDLIPAGSLCSDDPEEYTYDSGDRILTGELNQLHLSGKEVEVKTADSEYVIFIPPEPIVRFDNSNTNESSVVITDGDADIGVTITQDGQIRMD